MINIREYQEADSAAAADLLASLQDLVATFDPLDQFIHGASFDKAAYFGQLRETVTKNSGTILMAENEGRIAGIAVGWIKEPKPDETPVELHPKRIAYISDLVVAASERRSGVGHALLTAIEKHFMDHSCDYVALSYMVRNTQAHDFYLRNGYEDYSARMVKPLVP